MRCRFHTNGQTCEREAKANWTTCPRHYTAGMNRRQWKQAQKARQV